MNRNARTIFTLAGLAVAIPVINTPAQAALYTATPANSTDTIVGERQNGAPAAGYYTDDSNNVVGVTGSTSSGTRRSLNVVFGFTLPALAPGQTVDSATFNFNVVGVRSKPTLDVYLLDTASPDTTGTDFFFQGAEDTSVDVDFIGEFFDDSSNGSQASIDQDVSLDLTGGALTLFQSFYGGDHIPDQAEAFFRFNLDQVPPLTTSAVLRYNVNLDGATSSLEVTAIPEPASLAMGVVGLTVLTARRRQS